MGDTVRVVITSRYITLSLHWEHGQLLSFLAYTAKYKPKRSHYVPIYSMLETGDIYTIIYYTFSITNLHMPSIFALQMLNHLYQTTVGDISQMEEMRLTLKIFCSF